MLFMRQSDKNEEIEILKEDLLSIEKELKRVNSLFAIQSDIIKELQNRLKEKELSKKEFDALYAVIDELKLITCKNENHFVSVEDNTIDLNKICTVKSNKVLDEENIEIILVNGIAEKYYGAIANKLKRTTK